MNVYAGTLASKLFHCSQKSLYFYHKVQIVLFPLLFSKTNRRRGALDPPRQGPFSSAHPPTNHRKSVGSLQFLIQFENFIDNIPNSYYILLAGSPQRGKTPRSGGPSPALPLAPLVRGKGSPSPWNTAGHASGRTISPTGPLLFPVEPAAPLHTPLVQSMDHKRRVSEREIHANSRFFYEEG